MINDFSIIEFFKIAGPTFALMLIALALIVRIGTRSHK